MKDRPLAKVAWKLRRALRNGTGATFTHEELVAFAHAGALELATKAENEELLALYPSSPEPLEPEGPAQLSKRYARRAVHEPHQEDPEAKKARNLAYIAYTFRDA